MSDSHVTTLDDEVQDAPKPAVKRKGITASEAKEAGISGNRKRITVHSGADAEGRQDVTVGVNGVMYQLKRGKPIDVPVEVVEVLRNAVTTQYEDGQPIEVPRFAFSEHN